MAYIDSGIVPEQRNLQYSYPTQKPHLGMNYGEIPEYNLAEGRALQNLTFEGPGTLYHLDIKNPGSTCLM